MGSLGTCVPAPCALRDLLVRDLQILLILWDLQAPLSELFFAPQHCGHGATGTGEAGAHWH